MKKKYPAPSKALPSTSLNEDLLHQIIEALSEKTESIKDILTETSDQSPHDQLSEQQKLLNDLSLDESSERYFDPNRESSFINLQMAEEIGEDSGPSGFDYIGAKSKEKFCYEFTNSEFIAYLAKLDPIEYFIVVNIFAVIIFGSFNNNELEILYSFINNLGDALETILEQAILLESEKEAEERNEALKTDFDHLNKEVFELQQQIKQLQDQLNKR